MRADRAQSLDLEAVLASIREVAATRITASAGTVDRSRAFPEDGLHALADCGAFGLVIPAAGGGSAGGLSALAQACEAIGSACASTGMVFLMHSVTAATIAAGGGERADAYLRGMAEGRIFSTCGFSEPGSGAHFYAPELRAERSNGGLSVSGRKSFVTSAGHADLYLVLVQRDEGDELDLYVLEKGQEGLSFDGTWLGLGMAGNSSVAMVLDGVKLDEAARIGGPMAGRELFFSVVAPTFLVGLSAVYVGIAGVAAKVATEHARNRRYPDGSSLADIQFIQHAIADMDLRVRQALLLVAEAARLGDAGDEGALVAMFEAKIAATEAATDVSARALELCGGQGYTPALPIERYLRDAGAGAVMAPTNAVLRNWIGKALAGLPIP